MLFNMWNNATGLSLLNSLSGNTVWDGTFMVACYPCTLIMLNIIKIAVNKRLRWCAWLKHNEITFCAGEFMQWGMNTGNNDSTYRGFINELHDFVCHLFLIQSTDLHPHTYFQLRENNHSKFCVPNIANTEHGFCRSHNLLTFIHILVVHGNVKH